MEDSIEKSIYFNPFDPAVLFAYIQLLVEKLKEQSALVFDETNNLEAHEGFTFGKKSFSDLSHCRNYVYDRCAKLLALDPITLKYNLGIAELVHFLPPWARCEKFEKLCLKRGVLFHQDSGKAFKAMGFHILHVEKNVRSARKYFEKSNDLDPDNFSAVTALMYSTLSDIKTEKSRMGELLKRYISEPSLTKEQKATLYFIKGLFCLFFKDVDVMVGKCWIAARKESEEELERCFERLPSIQRTYQLNEQVFQLPNLCALMKETMDKLDKSDQNELRKIRKMIKKVGREELKKGRPRRHVFEKDLHSLYPHIENLVIGSDDKESAYKELNLKEGLPQVVVDDAYVKICRFYEDNGRTDNLQKLYKVNSAYATLFRHFERSSIN